MFNFFIGVSNLFCLFCSCFVIDIDVNLKFCIDCLLIFMVFVSICVFVLILFKVSFIVLSCFVRVFICLFVVDFNVLIFCCLVLSIFWVILMWVKFLREELVEWLEININSDDNMVRFIIECMFILWWICCFLFINVIVNFIVVFYVYWSVLCFLVLFCVINLLKIICFVLF